MLESLKTLATVTDYTLPQLEHLAEEFGGDYTVRRLNIPVSVLIRAKREYAAIKDQTLAARSYADVVALAEAHVNEQNNATFLALKRGVDNIRKAVS